MNAVCLRTTTSWFVVFLRAFRTTDFQSVDGRRDGLEVRRTSCCGSSRRLTASRRRRCFAVSSRLRLAVKRVFLCVLLLTLSLRVSHANDLRTLVAESCLDCHDDAGKAGGLSLEQLGVEITQQNAATWLRALEEIERGYMPPPDHDQPTLKLREAAIRDLEGRLVAFHSKHGKDRSTVLRRLNRTEYRNTIRDLLRLEIGDDLTSEFPGDQRDHGFATNGEKLVTSSFLLRKYLEVAEEVIDRAVHFEPRPETQVWKLTPPFDRTTGAEQGQTAGYFRKIGEPQPYQDICGRIGAGGAPYSGYHPLDDVSDSGAPVSGWYLVRIEAEAKFRHAFQEKYFTRWKPLWDGTEPIRFSLFTGTLQGIDPANKEARDFAATHEQASQRHVATWDLRDDQRVWLEARVWLEKGQFLRVGFPNGPTNSNHRIQYYFDELVKATWDSESQSEYAEKLKRYGGWFSFHLCESPRIRFYNIELTGPLNETWPPPSHRVIFGDAPYHSADADEVLLRFASKAWRRPVAASELNPIAQLVRDAEARGGSAEDAIAEGLKAILCSPAFLYREEQNESLTDYEIASRISYFLTASTPDEQLLKRADSKQLTDSQIRRAEAERLLSDPRSDAFVNEFLDGWLRLDKLGSMAPDPHRFSVYYDDRLEPAMRTETRLYFRHLLDTNGPIARFLDSDYAFVNKELAKFYGITSSGGFQPPDSDDTAAGSHRYDRLLRQEGVGNSPSTRFTRVQLTDRRRGGLLGHASVLTLTANGVDTSPVIRGVWLLENLLGTPPPPPPPDVPAIEPDIRGATTIREQLQKHRASAACRSCHAHIDPPGFALESFNPIGGWRGHYQTSGKYIAIDSTGEFGGERFKDIVEFKTLLLKRQDLLARCLVEKLLTSALGRELEITDRPHIRNILDATRPENYRLRDLVLHVVASPLLQQK
jgi:cytochrome c553